MLYFVPHFEYGNAHPLGGGRADSKNSTDHRDGCPGVASRIFESPGLAFLKVLA